MRLSDFKRKAVPGLYNLDHYEADNGAWAQVCSGLEPIREVTFCAGPGAPFQHFESLDAFKAFLSTLPN